jgi:hypothetical protein
MIFSIPGEKLTMVTENLFKAGNRIQDPSPFSMPHVVPTLGPNRILGEPVEPKVWPTLRNKMG